MIQHATVATLTAEKKKDMHEHRKRFPEVNHSAVSQLTIHDKIIDSPDIN